jgi:hypothetical protein
MAVENICLLSSCGKPFSTRPANDLFVHGVTIGRHNEVADVILSPELKYRYVLHDVIKESSISSLSREVIYCEVLG